MLFFKPLPFVKRVVFMATPHRGSFLTKAWVQDLVRKIISLPVSILTIDLEQIRSLTSKLNIPASVHNQVPTSIDGMSAGNPVLQTLASLPLDPEVTGHSIIAVKPGLAIESGNDGVVEYKSAHLPGMDSEFIVRSEHSCQGNPFAIEEVRRILLKHIGIEAGRQKPVEKPGAIVER